MVRLTEETEHYIMKSVVKMIIKTGSYAPKYCSVYASEHYAEFY